MRDNDIGGLPVVQGPKKRIVVNCHPFLVFKESKQVALLSTCSLKDALSNDEYSAQLGRRDITMAWHKTTKDVQEITDVIDLQGPARDYNMPSRDPAI
ncbi:hypothetical protein T459_07903 [Capsicum annuum]|uniref:Uncharacterized protein n=1 Tax=Capsicum annuum TaxID=4072 RepID=A0A2G2ZUZ9_CAPAN|nr:hypothetical protein T459_07903 [Capsicum annuum]